MKGSKYYRIIATILIIIITLLLQTEPVFAKRGEPAVIQDILYKNLRISAENSTIENMGVVKAYDINSGKLIWSTKVYDVTIWPWIETDTQYIFIKEMKIENDKLIIIDERNRVYRLNPMTGKGRLHLDFVLIVPVSLIIIAIAFLLIHLIKGKRNTGKRRQKLSIS